MTSFQSYDSVIVAMSIRQGNYIFLLTARSVFSSPPPTKCRISSRFPSTRNVAAQSERATIVSFTATAKRRGRRPDSYRYLTKSDVPNKGSNI
jgi:hypothetical protein